MRCFYSVCRLRGYATFKSCKNRGTTVLQLLNFPVTFAFSISWPNNIYFSVYFLHLLLFEEWVVLSIYSQVLDHLWIFVVLCQHVLYCSRPYAFEILNTFHYRVSRALRSYSQTRWIYVLSQENNYFRFQNCCSSIICVAVSLSSSALLWLSLGIFKKWR